LVQEISSGQNQFATGMIAVKPKKQTADDGEYQLFFPELLSKLGGVNDT